jgi:hypothetical protein
VTCDSIPNWIITGTVISDVLPVTTLIMLVKKITATRLKSFAGCIVTTSYKDGFVA